VKRRAFDKSYFAAYGPGGNKAYEKSWRDFTFDPKDVIGLYRALFDTKPKTLLDIGAANGALVSAFLGKGVEALGIENSPIIHRKIKSRRLKSRVRLGDAATLVPRLPDAAFDVIIECAAQYLPRKAVRAYLKQVHRACARLCCLLIQFKERDATPHQGLAVFETKAWWKAEMARAGFEHVAGGEGFFYRARHR
jgi:SAM-dependent methyltransferase